MGVGSSNELVEDFRRLDKYARTHIRALMNAERVSGEITLTLSLLDAASALLESGKNLKSVSRILGAAAKCMRDELELSDPVEPNQGGRPEDSWWTKKRKDSLLSAYLANPGQKKNLTISGWSKSLVAKTLPTSIGPDALRKRLDRLIEDHNHWEDLIDDFEEIPDE